MALMNSSSTPLLLARQSAALKLQAEGLNLDMWMLSSISTYPRNTFEAMCAEKPHCCCSSIRLGQYRSIPTNVPYGLRLKPRVSPYRLWAPLLPTPSKPSRRK